MGDRCTCYVTVKHVDKDKALEILQGIGWAPYIIENQGSPTTDLELSEVNYADLEDETKALLAAGIEHTIYNCAGGNYSEGYKHYRFLDNGELYVADYSEMEKFVDPEIVRKWLTECETTEEIRTQLDAYVKSTSEPEWDMECKNFKRYLLTQVVKP
ncbi:hypothetical protein WAJ79_14500 [Acinetobacter baumannii]